MRAKVRLGKLSALLPRCDGRVRRLVVAGGGPVEPDPCPRCGRDHTRLVHKVIVTAADDVGDRDRGGA